ncbi:conserved Plasmodium protein, unknown function [Plasmodium gallinaceum]|uniref:Uncharacterized protein n=1 Tax=Plasmodium gallinaceum TaxID=5849 RepID=A0A1J1GT02_PLAGA|nr:conserved Plasmodium protein, unknown function [Plasmodium gallinaceum]CRG95670.1 conserved Plasmodium protein, unknown function [Plasmodium gallinaceum]
MGNLLFTDDSSSSCSNKCSENAKKSKKNTCSSEKSRERNDVKLKINTHENNLALLKTKNRAKRHNPSNALLRNGIFCVKYKVKNQFIPMLLELKNTPRCEIVVFDDYRNIIKKILIKDIELIENSINTIDIFLRINEEYTEQNKFNLCSFILKDNNDKVSFIYNIKMLYGIDVLEYGKVKYNKINTEEVEEKYIYEKNVLDKENENNLQSLLDDINNNLYNNMELFEKNIDEDKMGEIINTCLKLGEMHNPIIILGDMEDGSIIKVKELNSLSTSKKKKNMSHDDFTLIEWFLSKGIGSNKSFREDSIHCGNSLLLKSFMIGYYIKVKVCKNIFINNKKTFVTSVSIKGPVTINDNTAKHVLNYLSNANESIQIYLSSSDIYNIFFSSSEPDKNIIGLFIFYPAYIFIMRKGLRFAITLNEKSYSVDYVWNSFYLTKKDVLFDKAYDFIPSYIDMSDIHLYFITLNINGDKIKSIIRTNSSNERNEIYTTVFFYKYQKRIISMNEWVRDSLAGSYSKLKKRFENIFIELKGQDLKKIDLVNMYNYA